MEYVIYLFGAYVIFCKAWPYCLYPNYLFGSKIEHYPELKELASRLRGVDKFHTVQNVYEYMRHTYAGHEDVLEIKNLLSVFELGDFSTRNILNKRRFLWCHTQNRLCKSILVNTGIFKEGEMLVAKRLWRGFYIHQWLSVELDGKKITVDPYYGLFKVERPGGAL